jgi:outer membrane protein assembly factor BamE (lipoprotein component of BamABCDE complex)
MYRWLLALSFVAATATSGRAQAAGTSADAGTIDPGMTRAQVIERLGKPATIRTYQGSTYLMYTNKCGKSCGMQDVVILDHDVVVDAMFRSPDRHYTGTSSSPEATKANSRTQRNQPLALPGEAGTPATNPATTTMPTLQRTTSTSTVVHTTTTTTPVDSAKTSTSVVPVDSARTPTSRPPADSAASSTSLPPTQSPPAQQIAPPLKDPQPRTPMPQAGTAPPTYGTPSTTPPPADSARSSMAHPPVDNSSSSTSHPPKPPQ